MTQQCKQKKAGPLVIATDTNYTNSNLPAKGGIDHAQAVVAMDTDHTCS